MDGGGGGGRGPLKHKQANTVWENSQELSEFKENKGCGGNWMEFSDI